MLKFPNITKPAMPLKEIIQDTAIKGTLENQTIIARKRFTRVPVQFELHWNALPEDEYKELREFFINVNGGVPFLWEYPFKDKTYTVRFTGDFEFSNTEYKLWQGSVKLVEV